MKVIKFGDYRLKTSLPTAQAIELAEDLLNQVFRVERVLKDEKSSSFVARIWHAAVGDLLYIKRKLKNK